MRQPLLAFWSTMLCFCIFEKCIHHSCLVFDRYGNCLIDDEHSVVFWCEGKVNKISTFQSYFCLIFHCWNSWLCITFKSHCPYLVYHLDYFIYISGMVMHFWCDFFSSFLCNMILVHVTWNPNLYPFLLEPPGAQACYPHNLWSLCMDLLPMYHVNWWLKPAPYVFSISDFWACSLCIFWS